MEDNKVCDLNYAHELIAKLEVFAKVHGLNFDIKIYDIDYEQCTTIKYDIPQ